MYDTPPIPGGQVLEGDWQLKMDNTLKPQLLDLLVQRPYVELILGTRGAAHYYDPKRYALPMQNPGSSQERWMAFDGG
jgi:hypothetical protein